MRGHGGFPKTNQESKAASSSEPTKTHWADGTEKAVCLEPPRICWDRGTPP